MGHVRVQGADLEESRIQALRVKIAGLPARTIDRPTALHWLRDGHSLLPVIDGQESTALQLVEVPEGDESAWFIRTDNEPKAEDRLPELPSVAEVGT